MKRFYLIFLLVPFLIYSQGENDNWYFGNKAAVNFSNTIPQVLTDSQLASPYANGTMSDSNGNLLFYTDGKTVMNRQHNVMDNGSNISVVGGYAQIVILKSPSNPNQFYIVNCASGGFSGTLFGNVSYSIVDMSLGTVANGLPLGSVLGTYKNIYIKDEFGNPFPSQGVTVVPHANGSSFWVLIPKGNKLYSYLVDSNGFSGVPIISNINSSIPTLGFVYGINLKSSPQINSVSFSNYLNINIWNAQGGGCESQVVSFDNATGQITNNYSLIISSLYPTTAEFNQNAEILYIGRNGDANIFAIDLVSSTTTVISNQIYSNSNSNLECYEIQRNKNNEIYINFPSRGYLSKIINPDVYGGSSVHLDNLYLNGKNTQNGLPQLVQGVDYEGCNSNLTLSTPETYGYHTYQFADYIITNQDYLMTGDNHIIMKAGDSIVLLPNTEIQLYSELLATIEPCISTQKKSTFRKNVENVKLKFDLDKVSTKNINATVYPNPVKDFLNVATKSKIEKIEVFDMSGRNFQVKFVNNQLDFRELQSGTYLINIHTKNGVINKKVMVSK